MAAIYSNGEYAVYSRGIIVIIVVCLIASVAISQPLPPIPDTDYKLIDNFSYSSQKAAKLWKPMRNSGPASLVNIGGRKALRLPCNFYGTKIERVSWDRAVKLDMTLCRGVQFLFYCPDNAPISSFNIFFRSGNGWYGGRFDAHVSAGWNTVKVDKKATAIEGRPAGWSRVDTIRISAWRGRDRDTEFYIASLGLFGTGGNIVIVRGDSAAQIKPANAKTITQYTDVMANFLDRSGLDYQIISDLDIDAQRLKDKKLVILPYNPGMPDNIAEQIANYIRIGGKLIACYILPKRLQAAVGIKTGTHVREEYKGYFASIRPSIRPLPGIPDITLQNSWNICRASAVEGRGRVGAWWYDNKGVSTGKPAFVVSDNCIFLTHVMLSDDPTHKLPLLLAMIGNLCPDLWRQAAQGRIDRIGRFGAYIDYQETVRGIRRLAGSDRPVLTALTMADGFRRRSLESLKVGDFPEAVVGAEKAHQYLTDAYCLAQKPLSNEYRAFWCSDALGVAGMTWDETIRRLAENGFTTILPNMLWGGVAYYNSNMLPVASEVREKGDQIELCLAACKKYDVQCHVWKVNYNMGSHSPKEFVSKMKLLGRTQVGFDGSANDRWLCPSHPENQRLEVESMLEVARKYDVHGLHFDYIRYPGKDGCFCKGCRRRFEKTIGRPVRNWPADLRSNSNLNKKWLDFRRRQINAVVAAVSGRAKKIRPGIQISAAVFNNWPVHRDSIGQDWKLWCESGWLDFVCPMDYTDSNSRFQRMIEQQLDWAGNVPCYPGIGLTTWPDPADIVRLIEQINITRGLNTGGFTIFNYGPTEANDILPHLGKGITRKLP